MIVGILLAAGRAERFGAPKLVAPLRCAGASEGVPIVRLAAQGLIASRVEEVVVVIGSHADLVRGALAGVRVHLTFNERFAEGMSSSLRAGVSYAAALDPEVEAVIIALGDQPTLRPEIVDALIARFQESRHRPSIAGAVQIVAPSYAGTRGNPVLFTRALFPELLTVTGDHGARAVVARDPTRVAVVELPFPPPRDVDTTADWRALAEEGP